MTSQNKYIFLDFEYNRSRNPLLNLISVAWEDSVTKDRDSLWLHNEEMAKNTLAYMVKAWHDKGYTFVAYAVTAEARSFHTLFKTACMDMKVFELKWIDLYLEYRMLLNHNANYRYGKHLIKGRVFDLLQINKYGSGAGAGSFQKPEFGLASACYKLLGRKINVGMKVDTRAKILTEDDEIVEQFKGKILEYNESDIDYLPQLLDRILEIYEDEMDEDDYVYTRDIGIYKRGNYAARTAEMEAFGYAIDYDSTKSFSDSVPSILFDLQTEINDLFPDIRPFRLDLKKGKYSWNQLITKEWVKSQDFPKWRETDSGDISLKFDAFADYFSARHDFPKDCFGSQIKRYLTFKKHLNGFLPTKKGTDNFWDFVGSDKRVRPYMGIYGSQSSRSQPKATGFLFLKSAWMRSLAIPKIGKAMCGIDFGSEEFFLGALMATMTFNGNPEGDTGMVEAYESGDPYTWFAKAAEAMPQNGSKATHPEIREAFKSTVLALQYDMGDTSLARKLTADTGEEWTVAAARRQSKMFKSVFPIFDYFRSQFVLNAKYKYQMTRDGWTLWKDNPNPRSQGNWPIQTMGAVVMREAVAKAQDRGLDVVFTLHDALYIEYDSEDYQAPVILGECMQEAFQECLDTTKEIRLDYDIWSLDYEGRVEEVKEMVKEFTGIDMVVKDKYIDPRGKREYETFKQYFTDEISDL